MVHDLYVTRGLQVGIDGLQVAGNLRIVVFVVKDRTPEGVLVFHIQQWNGLGIAHQVIVLQVQLDASLVFFQVASQPAGYREGYFLFGRKVVVSD